MTHKINISIAEQKLLLQEEGKQALEFSISSAKNGVGQASGSGCTPLGKHYIRAKIGNGCPLGSVFVGRRWTQEIYSEELAAQFPKRDWILSRILWLSGLELGMNRLGKVDSMQRYIYIHGTPDTEPMGVPLSHGCIRMRNNDLIQLFDKISLDSLVDVQIDA